MPENDQPTIIRKYANRRLYDTSSSCYVTLEDLAQRIRDGEDFVVHDAKSGEDITRSVLAQVIFEQESKEGVNLLPESFLREIIRLYGDSMQSMVPRYLEHAMSAFAREQDKIRSTMLKAFDSVGPKKVESLMEEQARRNMEMFQQAASMFSAFPSGAEGDSAGKRKESANGKGANGRDESASAPKESGDSQAGGAGSGSDEIAVLKEQVAQMRRKLDSLG